MDSTVLIENHCSADNIADVFKPVIEDAIATYRLIFGDAIANIRLMGSVARGEAGPHSDIDFIAVLDISPTEEQMQAIEQWKGKLRDKHPFIRKVDLEAVPAEGLHEFHRLVFSSDSVSLFGSDSYTLKSQFFDRQQLAGLVTPDLKDIMESYRRAVERMKESDSERLLLYNRLIGKDILKCFRAIAILRGGEYERNIGRICHQLLQYMPEQHELLSELYDLYIHPSNDKHRLLEALHSIERNGELLTVVATSRTL